MAVGPPGRPGQQLVRLGGQPRTLVRHFDGDAPVRLVHLDRHHTFAVPERIADQDVENLPYRRRGRQARGQLRPGHRDHPPSPRG